MQVIVVDKFGGPEVLRIVEEPDAAPGPGQIAVDVKAAGINFADIAARSGHYPMVPSAPFRPGFEVAGVVDAVGSGVTGFSVGERVMGMVQGGGYTSRAVLELQMAVKLPEALEFAPATALLVQGLTAYFLLETAGLKAGESVLIPGAAGGVGSLAVQMARLKGAGKIIGLASPAKHDAVREGGADAVFDYTTPGWSKSVREETGGTGVNIFLDSQGDLGGEGFETLGDGARWLVYGGQADGKDMPAARMGEILFKNITLRGYTLYTSMGEIERALPELLGWAAEGKLKISAQAFPLVQAAQAHEAISARKTTGKVVLTP